MNRGFGELINILKQKTIIDNALEKKLYNVVYFDSYYFDMFKKMEYEKLANDLLSLIQCWNDIDTQD